MKTSLKEAGVYVVAVSGGVDSIVLLDLLKKQNSNDVKLIVAHFDHGIRRDSFLDRMLVEEIAKSYNLPFVSESARLGPRASEALARKARYDFLNRIFEANKGKAIITAHHEDDLIETAIINVLRGSNRRGLTAIISSEIIRPLLPYSKADILKYAQEHHLKWREDSTNSDNTYLRNYIRHNIMPKLDTSARSQLIEIINKLASINYELDHLIAKTIKTQSKDGKLNRRWFNTLPHNVSKEILAGWFRQNNINSYDKITLERLSVSAKVGKNGQTFPVKQNRILEVKNTNLALSNVER